jgi:hypothetical protein
MTHRTCCLLCILLIVAPSATPASQLIPIDAFQLEALSDTIVVGIVETVERDPDNTIPKEITGYHIATVRVAFALKGSVSQEELNVRFAPHGNRAFDPELAKGDAATFFLKKAKGGTYRMVHPGSASLFPRGHFTFPMTKDREPKD